MDDSHECSREQLTASAAEARCGAGGCGALRSARCLTRRDGVRTAGGAALETVRWISPRGTLEVMDDFNLWVPIKMGYFKALGIEREADRRPVTDALASTKFVAQNKADMGYPSPGVLTASIDSGIGRQVGLGHDLGPGLRLRRCPRTARSSTPKQLKGKSIALGSAGWKVIVDPMLVELGIDPKSVRYVTSGAAVDAGRRARARPTPGSPGKGSRAQLAGQGLKLKYLIGTDVARSIPRTCTRSGPPTSTTRRRRTSTRASSRASSWASSSRRRTRGRPPRSRTAQLPDLQKTLKPQLALDSMLELAHAYGTSHRKGQGWGYNDAKGWANYLKIVNDLGQTKKLLPTSDVITNELVRSANAEGRLAQARADAKAFKLDATFAKTKVRGRLQDLVDRCRGAPRRGAPRTPDARRRRWQNPLAGHTNSYHTYGHDEALPGSPRRATAHVELSAVPGWTEHVDLDADRPSCAASSRATGSRPVSLSRRTPT